MITNNTVQIGADHAGHTTKGMNTSARPRYSSRRMAAENTNLKTPAFIEEGVTAKGYNQSRLTPVRGGRSNTPTLT